MRFDFFPPAGLHSGSPVCRRGRDIFKQTPPDMTIPTKDWISPKIKIREAAEKGKGMFAIEKIISGEPLIIFGGEYTDAERAKKAKSMRPKCLYERRIYHCCQTEYQNWR